MKTATARMGQLAPQFFAALQSKVAALQASGVDVIRLDVGSPDLPPAPHITEALVQAASQPTAHGYVSHHGPNFLRAAWAELYRRQFAVNLDEESEIVPLLGSKEGIFLITQAVVDPGEVVLIPDPGYLVYTQAARSARAEPYFMPLHAENEWLPDLDAVPCGVLKRVSPCSSLLL